MMPAQDDSHKTGGGLAELRRIAHSFHTLTRGWWSGSTLAQAWCLTLAVGASLIVMQGINVLANKWNGWFFDSLERRDSGALWQALAVLPVLVFLTAGIGVCIVLSRETLQTRWRGWITRRVLDLWLNGNRFQRLKVSGLEPAHPEYRIADDVRMTIEPLTDLVIGLFSAVVSAIAFIGILWSVGGGFGFTIGGVKVYIPAYFVLAAVFYGVLTSGLISLIGRQLLWKVAARNEAEAAFRSTLTLMRDRAEDIVLSGRAAAERDNAKDTFSIVIQRWISVIRTHAHITWITNSNSLMIASVPLLLAAPKYLAGDLTLGEVVRVAGAFATVQQAISWLVDNFRIIALWAASARRVVELTDALQNLEDAPEPDVSHGLATVENAPAAE